MNRIIKKVIYNEGYLLRVKFQENKDGIFKECDISYGEEPRPEFKIAFGKLTNVVSNILNMDLGMLKATGIEFKYSNSGDTSAKLSCVYYVEQAGEKTTISIPPLLLAQEKEEHSLPGYLTKEQQDVIEEVKQETLAYLEGQRAQITLDEAQEQNINDVDILPSLENMEISATLSN